MEAGILGAVFWMWVLFATGRAVLRELQKPGLYTPLIVFAAIALAWDVLFSPFGLDRRIVTPALLNIMLLLTTTIAPRRSAPVQQRYRVR